MNRLKNLSGWFYTTTSGRLVLIFLFLQIGINAFVFPAMQKMMGNGKEVDVLDLQFGISNSVAFEILDAMGEEGRGIYRYTELLVDGIYPIVYTLFLIFLMSIIFTKLKIQNQNWSLLNLFPLLTFMADYAENSGILTLIKQFPMLSDSTVAFTSIANQVKWASFLVSLVIILGSTIRILLNRSK